MIGTVIRKGVETFHPTRGEPYEIHNGVIRGEDGREYRYSALGCVRNGTTNETLKMGAAVYFGSVEDGVAAWVSWKPVDDRSASAMEDFHRREMQQ